MTDINANAIELKIQNIEGELVADSRDVAESLGIEHGPWITNIVKKYQVEIEDDFGQFHFQNGTVTNSVGATNSTVFVYLNEDQAICLMTYSKNTPQVRAAKRKLVKAFSKARKILSGKLCMTELLQTQIAFAFIKESYSPWRKTNPEADPYFRKLVSIPAQQLEPTEVQALTPSESPQRIIPNSSEFLPDPEAQKMIESLLEIIDSLGLAANRAGLAGNKSIKEAEFLAKQLENVRGLFEGQESKLKRLNDALKDSEVLIAGKDAEIETLQKALKLAQSNSDMAGAKLEGHEMLRHAHKVEVSQLKARIRDLEMQLRLQTPSIGSSSDPGDLPGLPPAR